MKYLAGLMLLVLVQCVSATECRVNGGAWVDPNVKGFNVYVPVRANIADGKVLLDGYTMECRHGQPISFPFDPSEEVLTSPDAVRLTPEYKHLEGGFRLSVDYPLPVRAGILLSIQRREPMVSVQGRPYINITRAPGQYIEIKSGSKIATVYLTIRTYAFGSLVWTGSTFVNIFANNALNLNPSTCTINNNAPINIDFQSVDPIAVGENPFSSPNKELFVLRYSCPDTGITSPLDITLRGTKSAFNSTGLATSNPDLATVMYRISGSAIIAPGTSFRTSLTNSAGADIVAFSLIRKPGSFPAAGPFTGSATLVMSVP